MKTPSTGPLTPRLNVYLGRTSVHAALSPFALSAPQLPSHDEHRFGTSPGLPLSCYLGNKDVGHFVSTKEYER